MAFLAVACDKKEPVTPDNPTPNVDPPTPQVIKVTGVKLDKTEATLKVGETVQLSATVEPANATEKSISWKTDDSSIANGKGLVTAVNGGTTTISVITKDGNMTAKFTITVKEPLSLKVYNSGKEVGDSLIYRLESTPGDSISFEVFDNATGAFVDADNHVVALGELLPLVGFDINDFIVFVNKSTFFVRFARAAGRHDVHFDFDDAVANIDDSSVVCSY